MESIHARDAEINYYYGSALAHLDRWDEARGAYLAGRWLRPGDERFPVELGGVAFKQKRYSEAARWLRVGLRLDPNDSYANNFLATIYFLQGNLEAAQKYWNRIAKPQIENVRVEPGLRVDPVLLDGAFAFAPATILRRTDFLTTQARVDGLGIFPAYKFQLDARDDGRFDFDAQEILVADGKFDLAIQARERNGLGNDKWEALLSTFRGVFYQTIYPEYFNLGHSATNLSSLARWDAQKRRLQTSLSGPLAHNPKYRYQVTLDLLNENWDIRPSFTGMAPTLGALNLRKEAVSGGITSFESGRLGWLAGGELSLRDYRNVFSGSILTPDILLTGYQLKQNAQLNYALARMPERRFDSIASISSEAGTIWSTPAHSFEKLQASLAAHWFPQMSGDDYAMRGQIRSGKTVGSLPFDELYMLGLERDNSLLMRAHIGTRDGRKGSAPLGRNYFLSNWEIEKDVYHYGVFGVKICPFLDTGKSTDPSPGLGSRQWLWDTGVQVKLRVLGVGITLTYGKDLRSGRNAFYAASAESNSETRRNGG